MPLMRTANIIQQLVELRNEPEADEYGILRAADHAFDSACQLIADAALISDRDNLPIPRGCASTDSEGGVRIDWIRPTAAVCLIVPASKDREAYIYYDVAGECSTEPATADALVRWLHDMK